MEALAELAGHPERCAPSVHIAGSKGKGSVTGMLASMLEAAGYRAGRYMSPHVSDIRERLCVGRAFFDEAVLCAAGAELREISEVRLPAAGNGLFDPARDDGEGPSYFELFTLYFFLCSRMAGCNVLVVETGMGGRLDSTNIVDPLVSVITLIELEHAKFLGGSIPAIAGEKAGIIKPGKPVVLAKQRPEALEVFRKKAEEKQSLLRYFPETAEIRGLKISAAGTDFTLCFRDRPEPLNLSIPVPGAAQAENAGLAVTALKTAFPNIGDDAVRQGLGRFRLPARFELIRRDPPVIIDGAHTPESAAYCVETFRALYGESGILIFGCAADKNAAAMARVLAPHFSRVIITTPGTFKASDPERVFAAFKAENAGPEKTRLIKETGEAVCQALALGREKGLPVLGTGSFYLAAGIREAGFAQPS
jgi:dihydrofolate synthase/folylpolyglutamate synthase